MADRNDSEGNASHVDDFDDPDALPSVKTKQPSQKYTENPAVVPPNEHELQIKRLQETVDVLRKEVARLADTKRDYDWHLIKCQAEMKKLKRQTAFADATQKGDTAGSAALMAEKYRQVKGAVEISEKLHVIALAKARDKGKAKLDRLERKKDAEIAQLRQVIMLERMK